MSTMTNQTLDPAIRTNPPTSAVNQERGISLASMILGLVSIGAGFVIIIPFIGLVLGIVGHSREPTGRAYAITGLCLNGLFVGLWITLIAALILTHGGPVRFGF